MIFNNTQKLLAGALALVLVAGMTSPAFAQVACFTGQTTLDVLFNGNCIIAGDKIFENWVLAHHDGTYDLSKAIVSPVTEDPDNPGLRFVTNDLSIPQLEEENFIVQFDVSTVSGEPRIKDFSLQLIEFETQDDNRPILNLSVALPFHDVSVFPNQLFDEKFFDPINTMRVSLDVFLSTGNDPNNPQSLQEFVARFSQIPEQQVAGQLLPLDSTSLFLAGIQSMTVWMVPTVLGLAGAGVYLVKFRKQ